MVHAMVSVNLRIKNVISDRICCVVQAQTKLHRCARVEAQLPGVSLAMGKWPRSRALRRGDSQQLTLCCK